MNVAQPQSSEPEDEMMTCHSYWIYQTPMGYKHVSYCGQARETLDAALCDKDVTCIQCKDNQQEAIEDGVTFVTQLGASDAVTDTRIEAVKKGAPLVKALNGDFYYSTVPAALSGGIMRKALMFLCPNVNVGRQEAMLRFAGCRLLKTPRLCFDHEQLVEEVCARLEVSTTIAVVWIVAALKTTSQPRNYRRKRMYPPHLAPMFDDLMYSGNKLLAHSDPIFVADKRMVKSHLLFPGWARMRPKLMDFYNESVRLFEEDLLQVYGSSRGGCIVGQRDQIFNYP